MIALVLKAVLTIITVLNEWLWTWFVYWSITPVEMEMLKFRTRSYRFLGSILAILGSVSKLPIVFIGFTFPIYGTARVFKNWQDFLIYCYMIIFTMTFTNRVIQVYRHFFSSYRADLSEQKDIFVIIVIFLIGFIFSGFAALSIEVIEVNGIFVLQKSSALLIFPLCVHTLVSSALLLRFICYFKNRKDDNNWESHSKSKKNLISIGAAVMIPLLLICMIDMWGIILQGQNAVSDWIFCITGVLAPFANSFVAFSVPIEKFLKHGEFSYCYRQPSPVAV